MKLFVSSTVAPAAKSDRVRLVALGYAGLLTAMVTLQLFEYEDFAPLLASFGLPGGGVSAAALAAIIVTSEVFALPFLLRMALSPLMRYFSALLGILVAAICIKLSFWLNVVQPAVENVGFLGTKVSLPVGWWAVFFSMGMLIAAFWSVWGMWPGTKVEPAKTKHKPVRNNH